MEHLKNALEMFLHLDKTLDSVIQGYGSWTYLLLFLIVFAETGLVVTPFLPGDSLLFAAGIFAARGSLEIGFLFLLLACAAIAGDTANYWVGKYLGPRIFRSEGARFLKKAHLDRTHQFFEKYGGKTIILARFVPIVRTFAPFVAGIGSMTYGRFLAYNVIGGLLWVSVCVFGGYFFGGLPFVKNNFTVVVLAIVFISLVPMLIEFARHRASARTHSETEAAVPAAASEGP
jgi:membrane-associated protein